MIKKYEFIDRTIHLIRTKLEEKLSIEATLEEMLYIAKQVIKELYEEDK